VGWEPTLAVQQTFVKATHKSLLLWNHRQREVDAVAGLPHGYTSQETHTINDIVPGVACTGSATPRSDYKVGNRR